MTLLVTFDIACENNSKFSSHADPQMSELKNELFHEVFADEDGKHCNNKVTIVGIGAVGMAAAFSILTQV